jgi:mannose/cellobiose epimerase-like protein (N-acyl-D-glucosamine 2-epimerase family)
MKYSYAAPSARTASLEDMAAHAQNWLFNAAAPLWRAELRGRAPLFPERLSMQGERDVCPHRLFVQARHIFSYCELGRLGWNGPWQEMVHANIDFLLERGRRADGFYVHRFDHEGEVLDARADLYDQGFVLLALAYAGRALSRPDLFAAAENLGDALHKNWRLPHGGYFEGEIAVCPPHRQNPHMHLLESFIALHEASAAPRWRDDAEYIAGLCSRSFLHSESGALLEYFDGKLSPLEGEDGRIVEPGHCFEWAWLFDGERGGIGQIGEIAEESEAIRVEGGLQAFEEQAAESGLTARKKFARPRSIGSHRWKARRRGRRNGREDGASTPAPKCAGWPGRRSALRACGDWRPAWSRPQ